MLPNMVGALSLDGQPLSLLPTWFQDISFILSKALKKLRNKSTQCGCFFVIEIIVPGQIDLFYLVMKSFIPYNKIVATNTTIEDEKND